MKAITYKKYGPPEVLQLKELKKTNPKSNEVLVKVHAASINSWDWDLLTGKPYIYRLIFGILKPKYKVIGSDIAGIVEAVGNHIKQFKPGDEVFGDLSGCGFGAFAEYKCVPENLLASKPSTMSFEEAAAFPQAGVLALKGLRQFGKVTPDTKILINGAGGGVGTMALQLAKNDGAEVTVVDKANKLEGLQTMGGDYVIDYNKTDFTKTGSQYHLIMDVCADHALGDYKRTLIPNGSCVVIGGSAGRLISIAFLGSWLYKDKKIQLLMHKPNCEDLEYLSECYLSGKIKPVIDRCFALEELPQALKYFRQGDFFGKIVITM